MRKTLEGATSELCNRTVHHRVPAAWECRLHWAGHVPQQPGFKTGGSRHLGPCRSESITAGRLTPLISWSRRSCWSDAHCHGASLITALFSLMETSFAVLWSEWRTHWTHVSLTVCTVKLLLLQTCWNTFWSRAYSTTFFANYQAESDVLIHMAPSSVLCFH